MNRDNCFLSLVVQEKKEIRDYEYPEIRLNRAISSLHYNADQDRNLLKVVQETYVAPRKRSLMVVDMFHGFSNC